MEKQTKQKNMCAKMARTQNKLENKRNESNIDGEVREK